MNNSQTRGRLTLLTIALIFALPIAVSMYFYFSDGGWRPGENTQKGDLVMPPRTFAATPLTQEASPAVFREVWTLLVPAGENCDAACEDALAKIRQLRLWLGPKVGRVQLVLLAETADVLSAQSVAEHPKLIIADPELSEDFRRAVGDYNNGQIFLVDPLGNLMMSYKSGVDMGDIRKDLGHLLRISNIG